MIEVGLCIDTTAGTLCFKALLWHISIAYTCFALSWETFASSNVPKTTRTHTGPILVLGEAWSAETVNTIIVAVLISLAPVTFLC